MRQIATIFSLSLAVLVTGAGTACTANIHDNTVNVDAKVSIDADANVDVDSITPGQSVGLTLKAENVTLVDKKATPTAEQEHDAAYFSIYLDSDTSTVLTETASTMVSVTIPADTKEGPHKLLCRLNKHDGTPTSTEESLSINVKASASVMTTTSTTTKVDAGG